MSLYSLNDHTFLTFCLLGALMLPLISAIICLTISDSYLWMTSLVAPVFLLASAVAAAVSFVLLWNAGPALISIPWFQVSENAFTANIFISKTTLLLLLVVSAISFLVHIYSIGYMAGDRSIKKYFAMLGFFTFSMQGIVLADNLLTLFFFWELVGFSSYMLIGHWSHRPSAARAAKKAFIMNRVGDIGFLVGIMIVWANTNTLDLSHLYNVIDSASWQTAASLCIFCGVIGKSAQFPLFPWLPDAMEGPTPVSALIHAATMVAAGVYLMIRIFPIFSDTVLIFVTLIGLTTAIVGALCALFQFDIKKILAYSTVSQLGLMIMVIGMGMIEAALLHLFTHAFFKACLFLSAGSIIHALHQAQRIGHEHHDVQDIRNMGGLRKILPITFLTFVISGASLAGIPFFSGFLSKEAMLASLSTSENSLTWIVIPAFVVITFLTVLYTFRMISLVFLGDIRKPAFAMAIEVPGIMRAPAFLLAIFSLWPVVSVNPMDFRGWLMPSQSYPGLAWISLFSVVLVITALIVSYLIFKKPKSKSSALFENGFFLDQIYQASFVRLTNISASATLFTDKKIIDKLLHGSAYAHVTLAHITGWFDKFIVDGVVSLFAAFARWIGSFTRSFQGGKIQLYIFWSVLGIIIFLIWSLNKW
jgi:NADH-quinone oxidoreductase subunit L